MGRAQRQREWDLFICHASEDKDKLARPLCRALLSAGYSVWFDETEIKLGDSLRCVIDRGLACSKYGVVILSPHFFEKHWPREELDGLAARESDGKKVILPVWHNVNQEDVARYSPMLAGKFAAETSKGINSIVAEVQKVLKPSQTIKPLKAKLSLKNKLEASTEFTPFYNSFNHTLEISDPDVKAITLNDFQEKLRDLCYNHDWNVVKDKIRKVLEGIIPEKLHDDPQANHYIQFLAMIINCFREHVAGIIDKKWAKELEEFYSDPAFDTSSISNVLTILLQLHRYSKDYLIKLIDDASFQWSTLKFQTVGSDLGVAFGVLENENKSDHEEIVCYLLKKMEETKKQNKEAKENEAYNRLYTLFKMANR